MRTALLYDAHRCLAVGPNFGVRSGTSTLKHVLAKMDWSANHREARTRDLFLACLAIYKTDSSLSGSVYIFRGMLS